MIKRIIAMCVGMCVLACSAWALESTEYAGETEEPIIEFTFEEDEMYDDDLYYEEDNEVYVDVYDGDDLAYYYDAEPFVEDMVAYLPLRQTLNIVGIPDENIVWSDGKVNVDIFGDLFELEVDSDVVLNGEYTFEMSNAMKKIGDYTYVSVDFFEIIDADFYFDEITDDDDAVVGVEVTFISEFIDM